MKKIASLLVIALGIMALTTACNDEWTEEQYEHYISFKAPIDDTNGVTPIYVPLTRHNSDGVSAMYGEGISDYDLPLIVSGTTTNERNITVHIEHDTDTLDILNYAWFSNRTELYYEDMNDYASYPETVDIHAGDDTGLLHIIFDFNANGGIDLVEKWVLPLTIVDKDDNGNSYGYDRHPRKYYAKALLRVFPFNDYSGDYSATTLTVSCSPGTPEDAMGADGSGLEYCRAYAVSDTQVFFYAGSIDESRTDRGNYKIYATFTPYEDDPDNGTVDFTCDNPLVEFNNLNQATYTIYEYEDDVQPYMLHHYVIISDIEYTYCDYTIMGEDYYNRMMEQGQECFSMYYYANGSMTLGREINTQIPDQDQAYQW